MTALDQAILSRDFGVCTGVAAPPRLSAATRALAVRFLSGEFGSAMRAADFGLTAAETAGLSPDRHYARVIRLIAERADLRLLPAELLVGAAPLLEAAQHRTPGSAFPSISHTTIGFAKALRLGYRGLRQQLAARLARPDLDARGREFLEGMRECLAAAGVWHARHVAALADLVGRSTGDQRRHYQEVLAHAETVPENPPRNFREALQALWFLWEFQRLCGNWSGLGRVDKLLGPFLRADLAAGRLTRDAARELLAHFWIKGCEWIGCAAGGSGDAQFYQNVVLGGVDEAGHEVTNDVTYLILDVVEELHISDFPIAVRVGAATPAPLLRRVAEVQRRGGGIVAIYNEDLILRALTRFGYPLAVAREFANDGCWEIIIPGQTAFGYQPFDTLLLLQEALGLSAVKPVSRQRKIACDEWRPPAPPPGCLEQFADFESLHATFRARLAATLDELTEQSPFYDLPCPLLSLLVDDCIERGRSYAQGGPVYTVRAPHAGGLPDTANSLLALKKLVFDERRVTLAQFVGILRADWAGHEPLRQELRQRFPLYGNDDPEADAMVRAVYDDFVGLAGRVKERHGALRPPGISTFGRELAFRAHRLAAAHGARRGEILATNFAPTPGTDKQGPTAVIRSFCKMDFEKLPNGVPLELKILPHDVAGPQGVDTLVGLLRTFVSLGGVFLQIDVVDADVLRDAQRHPERYPNLAVRISGWSARFVTLDRDWQDLVIQRTQQRL